MLVWLLDTKRSQQLTKLGIGVRRAMIGLELTGAVSNFSALQLVSLVYRNLVQRQSQRPKFEAQRGPAEAKQLGGLRLIPVRVHQDAPEQHALDRGDGFLMQLA